MIRVILRTGKIREELRVPLFMRAILVRERRFIAQDGMNRESGKKTWSIAVSLGSMRRAVLSAKQNAIACSLLQTGTDVPTLPDF